MLRECRGRVATDLRRFYGISLERAEAGGESLLEVAELVANVPRGGAIREWEGGLGAVSAEAWELAQVGYGLTRLEYQAAGKKTAPPAPELPEGAREVEAREQATARRKAEKAAAAASMAAYWEKGT